MCATTAAPATEEVSRSGDFRPKRGRGRARPAGTALCDGDAAVVEGVGLEVGLVPLDGLVALLLRADVQHLEWWISCDPSDRGQHLDLAPHAWGTGKASIRGDQGDVERLGQRHEAGVVRRHRVPELPRSFDELAVRDSLDRELPEVTNRLPAAVKWMQIGEHEAPNHRQDLEIHERRCRDLLAHQPGACQFAWRVVVLHERPEDAGVSDNHDLLG